MATTITNVTELQAMENDLDGDYVLGNNIDASETETWNINNGFIPIGFYGTPFSGTFVGNDKTISDLWSRRSTADHVGLFGKVDGATIQNVTLADFTIIGEDKVGSLVGEADNSTISDVAVTGTSVTSSATAASGYAGGLIGDANTCIISRCSTTGSVFSSKWYTGGLIGACYSSIIGQCYSVASITSSHDYNGGLIGLSWANDIDNCHARGDVTGDQYIGGLIGYSYDSIDDCYSTGKVTGNYAVGGLIGRNTGTVTNCFWDITTSGTETSDGGTGYATATMLLFATYGNAGWNIGNVDTTRNDGYPFLSWEIGEGDTIWKIFGEGVYSFNFPDLMDNKGRHPKNARLRAYRTDVYGEPYIIEEQYTDHNGTATFSKLPIGIGAVFQAVWGGKSGTGNEEWFFLRVNDIEDGGTGAATAAGALDNLGVHGAAIMWELILGD